ncbi:TPA: prepilin-type N-terminal cleavage/methylation domain-containing protein [Candidatus Scatenecus faecavium]|uniref:Prepilin-type N-terminal cleavage/methylation domain-containing protein n=1 Tax=Candidatus Scatenecus faecavium TaxID=2840915 RepID=A0A9D1K598_9BACT|nr:prepilin-type N-terminal cleavage/methylation domain-containing protein [Candidatus Scatenecus faecavium]
MTEKLAMTDFAGGGASAKSTPHWFFSILHIARNNDKMLNILGYRKGNMKKGFTLAEVLITLGIIGIIAAMTLPTVIKNNQRKEAEAKLKKAYSAVSQAFLAAQAKHGEAKDWAWDNADFVLSYYIAPEIKGAKLYPSGKQQVNVMCFEDKFSSTTQHGNHKNRQYVWMTGVGISTPFTSKTASLKMIDGTCIGLIPDNALSAEKILLVIDINGNMIGPNTAGYDLFFFVVKDNQILPYGYNWRAEDLANQTKTNSCNRKAGSSGFVCAAKVMADGWEIKYW